MLPMDLILTYAADALLLIASLGAAVFCLILSRRLSRLSRVDNGLGGAIAVLSAQVDDMSKALSETKSGSEGNAQKLEALNREARQLAGELEMMLAACHDLETGTSQQAPQEENLFAEDPLDQTEYGMGRPDSDGSEVPLFLTRQSRLARVS